MRVSLNIKLLLAVCALSLSQPVSAEPEKEPHAGPDSNSTPPTKSCSRAFSSVNRTDKIIMGGVLVIAAGAGIHSLMVSRSVRNTLEVQKELLNLSKPADFSKHPAPLATYEGVRVFNDFEGAPYRTRAVRTEIEELRSALKTMDTTEVSNWGLEVTEFALSKYPKDSLSGILHAVYLAGTISQHDWQSQSEISLGGFAVSREGYIVITLQNGFHFGRELEHTIHHEVGELLLTRAINPFEKIKLEREWRALMPPGFQYHEDDYIRIRETNPDLNFPDEFLSHYSQKSWTEDFCEVFAEMMRLGERFWTHHKNQPVVLKKAELVLDSLQQLDRRLNRSYIDDLGIYSGSEPIHAELFERSHQLHQE